MASITRRSRGGTTESTEELEELANLMRQGLNNHQGQVYRTARILGWWTKDNQIKVNIPDKDYSAFSLVKYKFMLEAPFDVSARCCGVMKKSPLDTYARQTKRLYPITAQMASESRLRTQNWLKHGCNMFDAKHPKSNPLSFWTEQDILLYIRKFDLPIAPVYGKVVTDDEETGQINFEQLCGLELFDKGNCPLHTTGCNRTGCVFCGFGAFLEKESRFELIDKVSNPALRDFCMRGGAFDTDGLWKPDNRGLGYWFVMRWIALCLQKDVVIPEYDRYEKEYGNERTKQELIKAAEIGNDR